MATGTLGQLQNQAKGSIVDAAQPGISFAPSALEQTQQMAQAATGKAESGGVGVAVSNIGEQVATQEAAKQQQQLATQANAMENEQQLKEQEQYMQLHEQELDIRNQALNLKQQFNSRISQVLAEFREKGDELSIEKQKAQVDQITQMTRLLDDKYINNLKIEGTKNRLANKAAFAEAALDAAFDNQLALLQDDFEARSLLKANDRDFNIKLEKMGMATAMNVVNAEIEAAKTAQAWRAAGSTLEAGISAYGKGMFDSKETATLSPTSKVGATDIPGSPGYLENLTSTNSVQAPAPSNFVLQSSQNRKG
jgi:hypothetical protein